MTGETAQVSSATTAAPSRAVFLSYASEDAPAAQRIADALRAAGVEGGSPDCLRVHGAGVVHDATGLTPENRVRLRRYVT